MAQAADSDFRYIDKGGNLLRSRTELTVSRILDFSGVGYKYAGGCFETPSGRIMIVDSEEDMARYRGLGGQGRTMAVGSPRYASRTDELGDVSCFEPGSEAGSIFLEDASFSFDYAHILPLVKKCSILHGHTSSVMVELAGQMKDNLLLDFGEAKRIVRGVVAEFDHKFFINKRYVESEDDARYVVSFDGPRGRFELKVPKDTTYLLEGEATVENLSTEMIRLLAPRLPPNVEAVGVYVYEGYNKGSHIMSRR